MAERCVFRVSHCGDMAAASIYHDIFTVVLQTLDCSPTVVHRSSLFSTVVLVYVYSVPYIGPAARCYVYCVSDCITVYVYVYVHISECIYVYTM